MARVVKLDLRGAPPVSGGMRDHIPPGRYRVQVVKVEATTSKSGKSMWTGSYKVSYGEYAGSNLGDNFVLVDNSNQPSKMGIGRLHHFLLCLNLPVKEAVINLDLDNLSGRECEVEVQDETFKTNDGTERETSAIRNYFPLAKSNGNGATAVAEPQAITAPTVVETVDAPVEVTEDEADEIAIDVDDLFK